MKQISIKGQLIDISLTVGAYWDICELCENATMLRQWIEEKNSHARLKTVVEIMAKGAAGKSGKGYNPISFPRLFNGREIIDCYCAIFKEIEQAMYFEEPENVRTTAAAYDLDLEEIRRIRAEEKDIRRPNKALSIIARGLSCGLDYESITKKFTPGEIMQIWLYQLESKGGNILNGK